MKFSAAMLAVALLTNIPIAWAGPVSLTAGDAVHVIDFESLPGMPSSGRLVPVGSQLTDQFADLGILFRSFADYAAVVDLGDGVATSGVNGIAGVVGEEPTELRPDPELSFDSNVFILFVDPLDPSVPGRTSFFSVRADRIGGFPDPVTVLAIDAAGNEIASDTQNDVGGQTWTIAAPAGISQIILPLSSNNSPIAFDDVTFAPVAPIPLPPALLPAAALLLPILWATTRRSKATVRKVAA